MPSILVLGATGCGRAAASVAAPVPPPPPVIAHSPLWRIHVCVVENGLLVQSPATYDTRTGDTTFAPPGELAGTPAQYAADAPWYLENEPVAVDGRRYHKFGVPRVAGRELLVPAGVHQGVLVFAERHDPDAGVLYVPVRPGCVFQPYQWDLLIGGVRG